MKGHYLKFRVMNFRAFGLVVYFFKASNPTSVSPRHPIKSKVSLSNFDNKGKELDKLIKD